MSASIRKHEIIKDNNMITKDNKDKKRQQIQQKTTNTTKDNINRNEIKKITKENMQEHEITKDNMTQLERT
jgi:hypothetical protein